MNDVRIPDPVGSEFRGISKSIEQYHICLMEEVNNRTYGQVRESLISWGWRIPSRANSVDCFSSSLYKLPAIRKGKPLAPIKQNFLLNKTIEFVEAWIDGTAKLEPKHNHAKLILLSKTGNPIIPHAKDTRPICVQSHKRKLLEQIWLREVEYDIWKSIGDYQQGFRPGGHTAGQIRRLLNHFQDGRR
jgi:hypothetical protein